MAASRKSKVKTKNLKTSKKLSSSSKGQLAESSKKAKLAAYQYTPPIQVPLIIANLQRHFERTFDLWNIKNPPLKIKAYRTIIFISAMLCTIFWPIQDIITNGIITILIWILLSLWSFKIPRFLLMLNLMLSISFLYFLMKIIIPVRHY